MRLLTNVTSSVLWQEVIKNAETRCEVNLNDEIEFYLIALLMRYTKEPHLINQILAISYLEALHLKPNERIYTLQTVGDQCLLFTGLFPRLAQKRNVKISYFVDLGQSAYAAISKKENDLYGLLALKFVVLMDVLQSIREYPDLLPLEAYEQWEELGSKRALKILQTFTRAIPITK